MIHASVVGTGNICHAHIPGLLTFPERVKIVALCDIYPEKAEYLVCFHTGSDLYRPHRRNR